MTDQRTLAAFEMLDHRRREVALTCTRDLQIETAGARVQPTRARPITLIATILAAFVRFGADMLVELRLNRRVVDQRKHAAQDVNIAFAQQIGKGRSLLRRKIERFHLVLSLALHSARVGPQMPRPPVGGRNPFYTLFRALPASFAEDYFTEPSRRLTRDSNSSLTEYMHQRFLR